MIKLASLKNQKVQGTDNAKVGQKKISVAQLRVQKGKYMHYHILYPYYNCDMFMR